MSSNEAIEKEIVEKGKTAPRVTLQDIQNNIEFAYYFTAHDGALNSSVGSSQPAAEQLKLLTFCVLVLKNGFMVTGESACASPENFDAEIGKKIARGNAEQKIWGHMGYELRTKLQQG
ncbi:MAG: hypothetical protein E6R03_08925 [Hyphomicrobiaceae bacterium]|nr:MAG: hypothetical protein E6R03_08925 [Hyphomicrobiaceae bacterium]